MYGFLNLNLRSFKYVYKKESLVDTTNLI